MAAEARRTEVVLPTRVDLQNLSVGPALGNVVRPQLEAVKIGPFSIRFVEDYETRHGRLSAKTQMRSSMKFSGGLLEVSETEMPPRYAAGWVTTAVAEHDGAAGVESVFAEIPIKDDGVLDLCELLTLVTGRRVTCPEYSERHGAAYRHLGRSAKVPLQSLHVAAAAWPGRENVVACEMEMAIPSHNQAVSDMIQTQASHYTTALDIVCAKYPAQSQAGKDETKVSDELKVAIKEKLTLAVNSCEGLTDAQKEAFVNILCARVQQGTSKGFVGKRQDVLTDLGAIPENPPKDMLARVKFIDTARNAIIHNGRLPRPGKDETRLQLGQKMAYLVYTILPEINRQAFFRVLEVSPEDRARFSLDEPVLREFFTEGKLGPTIESVSDLRILEKLLRPADELESNDAE
jgi:hypothetical protein